MASVASGLALEGKKHFIYSDSLRHSNLVVSDLYLVQFMLIAITKPLQCQQSNQPCNHRASALDVSNLTKLAITEPLQCQQSKQACNYLPLCNASNLTKLAIGILPVLVQHIAR